MLILYSLTIFVSAFLLFLIQPMVGKMLLPLLGGAPAVWNACMVFFQVTLLGGYLYAHFSIKVLGPRRQILVHGALLLGSLMALPILVRSGLVPPTGKNPVYWLFGSLISLVGVPFFLISSSAPLLQRWFGASDHPFSEDPYFLYSASNAGSLLALISFPLVIEPMLNLYEQGWVWSGGYGILILLLLSCGSFLWRKHWGIKDAKPESGMTISHGKVHRTSWRVRGFWIFTSFVPSSLMLGVTAFITTDLAAIPLLWILPLALYLLTFIIVFARKQFIPHELTIRIFPLVIIPAAPLFFMSLKGMEIIAISIHLVIFFVAALLCHGELVRSRPDTRHLTEFYFWMSTGGMLGGIFNTLVAPLIFTRVIEYPLVMAFVFFLLPCVRVGRNTSVERWRDYSFPLILLAFNLVFLKSAQLYNGVNYLFIFYILFAISGLFIFSFKDRPIRAAISFGVLLVTIAHLGDIQMGVQLYASRDFFGVKRVFENNKLGVLKLYHGSTLHGEQFIGSDRRNEPLTYYCKSGPVGEVFSIFNQSSVEKNVAVIGLGAGSVASYAKPGQRFDFFEIDQGVIDIARNMNFFDYLGNCKGSYHIITGDGRLKLAAEEDQKYGLILIDAFSSDSIPVHLLTEEALRIYLRKLTPGGLLVFHISNRYLNIEPLLGNLAERNGLICFAKYESIPENEKESKFHFPSHYVVMGRFGSVIGNFSNYSNWHKVIVRSDSPIWTDQYSNLFSLIKW